jgi:hypothetical protein
MTNKMQHGNVLVENPAVCPLSHQYRIYGIQSGRISGRPDVRPYFLLFLNFVCIHSSVAGPGSSVFYPLNPGSRSGINFFRISDLGSGPFFSEIFLHYLQESLLFLWNWATLKTYSWNHTGTGKQKEKIMFSFATPFAQDLGSGIRNE